MTATDKPIAILPLPADADLPIETLRCAEGDDCCYVDPCHLGWWLDTDGDGNDVPRFDAVFLLVFPDLSTRAVCAECADNYRAGFPEALEASPPCTGFEYPVNPDAPEEGIDVHHEGPCPVHRFVADSRYSPGASGATVPDDAEAVYSARWIDRGYNPADVIPDRQGFAYTGALHRDVLMARLAKADPAKMIGELDIARDETTHVIDDGRLQLWARRAGGYIYVDAWIPA